MIYFCLAVSLIVGVGIFDLPGGYYVFLRIIVSLYCLVHIIEKETYNVRILVVFCSILFIYNPIFPFFMMKDMWIIFDIIVLGFFLTVEIYYHIKNGGLRNARKSKSSQVD